MTDTITIDCGQRLSIDQAEALFSEAEKSVHHGGEITLDASAVQFCDTAGLQLLLSLQITLEKTATVFTGTAYPMRYVKPPAILV
ncbi:MAG: hypothetical protein CMI02_02560 [Oceanospirillaceae bacterium]|nr:hypothetical protein [Oceanospirillaceae bacterium]